MQRPRQVPPQSDPLGEALHRLQLTGTLYCRAELTAPWGVEVPPLDNQLAFLIVSAGRAWLEIEGSEPLRLETGSFTLLTHGIRHCVRSSPEAAVSPLFDLPVEPISDRYEILRHGGGGERSLVTYGVLRLDHVAAARLVALLPRVLTVDSWQEDPGGWLESTLRFIAREASELRPGGETVITRLADVLVIQAIRNWLDTAPEAHQGWLAALRDPQIGRALALLHRAPNRDWDVASLAREVGMSRSTFSARFTELVGESVMRYLTDWRLRLAHASLQESNDTLAEVADRVGYQSEAAFCRAFKRAFGVSPGSVRR